MKTLKQLREEHDSRYVPQNNDSEQLVLEAKSKSLMRGGIPPVSQMPSLLLFRRVSYRMYPDNQVVALYYSKMVDKYLSVPFGPTGNLNLSESKIYDSLEDMELAEGAKWEAIKGGIKGGLHGAAKGFFRGAAAYAEPGAAIGSVVGGLHGAYKGGKKAYEKSKNQTVKESFRDKLTQLREEKDDDPYGVKAAISLVPGAAAYQKYKEGDYAGAAKSAGLDVAMMGAGKALAAGARFAKRGLSGVLSKFKKTPRDPSAMTKSSKAPKAAETPTPKPAEAPVAPKSSGALATAGELAAGGGIVGAGLDIAKRVIGSGATPGQSKAASTELLRDKPHTKTVSSWRKTSDPVTASKLKGAELRRAKTINENTISDIRDMISQNIQYKDIIINEKVITLNTNIAKRILEVYDSVNTKNKKIVESMLNEDLDTFKKLLNFSIRK